MFIGRSQHKIDDKGRTNIPVKMRVADKGLMYSDFIITKGMNGCLALFPEYNFEKFIENFDPTPLSEEEEVYFNREFFSYAHSVSVDGQGRVKIPPLLLSEANLDTDVLILGANYWIEFWNPEDYARFKDTLTVPYEQVAKYLFASFKRKKKEPQNRQEENENSGDLPPSGHDQGGR
ncbi:hypothetical protein JW877_06220 [bacterium]|nr:hypothetical protein [bacterium]